MTSRSLQLSGYGPCARAHRATIHEQCILAQLSILALHPVTKFIGLYYAVSRLLGIVIGCAGNRSHSRHTCVALTRGFTANPALERRPYMAQHFNIR